MNENIEKPTMQLPPLKKICMTIGQLPVSYVETMSYYEMLVWFVHYLRDYVIPVVNANGEAVEELQELYTELQDYVNNYFDNLDVQEEINNKLDEMAEDGTLTNLIKDYVDPIYEAYETAINEELESFESTINTKVDNMASGSPLVASSTSGMTDTTRVYVNTTDGHWYYYNGSTWVDGGTYQSSELGDGSVHEYNLNSSILSRYDQEETISFGEINQGIIQDDGTINSGATWVSYTKVSCSHGQKLRITHNMSTSNYFVAFYDDNDTFISGVKGETPQATENVNVPSNTDYALIQGYNITGTLSNIIRLFTIKVKVNKTDTLFENSLDFVNSLMIIKDNTNLKTYATNNKFVNYDSGIIGNLNGVLASDYVEVIGGKNITISSNNYFVNTTDNRGLAFYDIDKNYISGIQYTKVKQINTLTPPNAKYLRITMDNVETTTYEITYDKLSEILNFEPQSNIPLQNIEDNGGYINIFNQIMCIGDSLTRGALEGYTLPPELWSNELLYSYPKQMERTLGNTVYNMGVSGATTKAWYESKASFIENSDYAAQCYIIALGTNDIGYNDSFDGDVSTDINTYDYTQNADTSVGWYGRIIQRIRAKYPDAVIFCCGIPNTRNSLETRTAANEKISAICTLLECYFLDFQTYGVQPDNVSSWKAKYYKGGHLNVVGYKQFANMVINYINYYIGLDPYSFWKVPFVNLDLD